MASRIIVAFVSQAVDSNITVASTFPGVAFDYAGVERSVVDRADQLRRQLEICAAELDLPISFIHEYGDPKTELTRIAEEAGADIIVVGKSTKARHHLAGSLGRRLIGQRGAPIVVVVPWYDVDPLISGDHLLWAFPCSLGAAASFGASNVAQMRAARRTESRSGIDPTLLARLARDRLWLTGLAVSALGYALQAIALFLAPVVLVQPVIVIELLFALGIGAALAGVRLGLREWFGALLVAGGLAIIVFTSHPSGNRTHLSGHIWVVTSITVVF